MSKFIIPHPHYLANQLWEDIAHHIKSIFIVFLASIAVGYIFGFIVSGYFIDHLGISKLPMWSILSVCTLVQRAHLTFIFEAPQLPMVVNIGWGVHRV